MGLIAVVGLIATSIVLGGAVATAYGASSIEGVWSFSGGKVAVQGQADGEFTGTVVAATTFAQCPHPVGETMWTGMRQQPDGSYWGLHQWYFESTCMPNPLLGRTAWRILEASAGARLLRVCFGYPGAPQPLIAPDGTSSEVTSPPCIDSELIAPLPSDPEQSPAGNAGGESPTQFALLPSAHTCVSRRAFQIHLRDPKNDPIKQVLITLRGRRIHVARHANMLVASVNLSGLPAGTFTVRIRATTVLGNHLAAKRTYHTCAHKRSPS